ncbi:MAG TPA: DUF393 domain-containing protein [Anaerolineaceae bacterium]|nr:DUF393 domain-containing protein [Anaerolineaceae bacterium]
MESNGKKIIVFYDGSCPFCTYSAMRLKRLDWLDNLIIFDLNIPDILMKYQIPYEDAILRIQILTKNQERKQGMEALFEVSKYVPLLWFFIPIFWLVIKLGYGTKIYDWIAKNRFLFPVPGYCPMPKEPESRTNK